MKPQQTAIGFALAFALAACRGGNAPESRPPSEPSSAPSAQPSASQRAQDAGKDPTQAQIAIDAGMPHVAPVLADAALAGARERADVRDWSAAARALDAATAATTLDADKSCARAYVSGRLHALAGEMSLASSSFERAIGAGGDAGHACALLTPYASLRAAEALVKLGRWDDAIARARAADDDEDIAARDEAKRVLADALQGKGDRGSAVPLWRALLASGAPGAHWAETATQLASALLDGVEGAPETHAREALDLLTRVLVEAPLTAETSNVAALRDRAAKLVAKKPAPPLSAEERARQAQSWYDAGQHARARGAADLLLGTLPKQRAKDHREAACKAAIVRAQSIPHGKHQEAADAWRDAITRCESDESLVVALYQGGKASASAHRTGEAVARFARVEKLFPKHRFADDARLHAAMALRDAGDEGRYVSMLASLPDAYPEGDMRGEALFRVALEQVRARDWAAARGTLDKVLAIDQKDHAWATAGRAAYFRARAAQLAGDLDDAKTRYAAIVADEPLAFYMLLAQARLRAMDPAAAAAAVQDAVMREAGGPLLTRNRPEFATPAFTRFVGLLEVGDVEAARREVSAAGWAADGADPELVWAIAWSYEAAGALDVGHSFTRARVVDYRAHWPAGRWKLAWQIAFPRAYGAAVSKESDSARIPPALAWAVMREESAFNPDAHSGANALGLMQLLPTTALQVARGTSLPFDEQALHRPDVSVALGARLLSSLRASFAGNPSLAIAAYNGGPSAVRHWLGQRGDEDFDVFVERIPFDETRGYIKRVLASQAAYAYLYAPDALAEVFSLPAHASGDAIASGTP